jgi:hypothetical protein
MNGRSGMKPQRPFGLERIAPKIVARDAHGAGRWLQDPRNHAHRGRFAGAIGPEETKQLAPRDHEIERAHGRERTVTLGESGDFNHERLTTDRARIVTTGGPIWPPM